VNAQVLLDPLEKQFHLPALALQLPDDQGGQIELISQQYQSELVFGIIDSDPSQGLRIGIDGPTAGQFNGLIAAQGGAFVHWPGSDDAKFDIMSGAYHKKASGLVPTKKPDEIQITPVHYVIGPRRCGHFVQHFDIRQMSLGDRSPSWQIPVKTAANAVLAPLGESGRSSPRERDSS
jgi:hypothetical protein